MRNFGNIFYIDNKEYVHLLSDDGIIFAARIFDKEMTDNIKRVQAKQDRLGKSSEKTLYCYVELSTEEYIDCSANMVTAATGGIPEDKKLIRESEKILCEEDLKNIQKEILGSSNLFRPKLVEFIKSLSI